LAQSHGNVSEWSDLLICRLLYQRASSIKNLAQHVGLVHWSWNHLIKSNSKYRQTCSKRSPL